VVFSPVLSSSQPNCTIWRLDKMNLAIRGIDSDPISQGVH